MGGWILLRLKIKHSEPEYARLDLTAIIKYLRSTVQKISQTGCVGNYYISGRVAGTFGTRAQTLGPC